MSIEITTAFVEQYKGNVTMLAQQKGSRLRGTVHEEPVTGKHAYFEQIGPTEAQDRTTRHGDSPLVNTPHDRRRVSLITKHWGDMVDDPDKVRMLIDPTSAYAQNAAWAMGRAIDDELIAAATGTAFVGEAGTTARQLPAKQKVALDYVESGSAADSGLTIAKLRRAAAIFGENDIDEDEERIMVVSQEQLTNLLMTTEVTSADFNVVRALVEGTVHRFMGFRFIRTQRLKKSGGVRTCFAYVRSGIALGVGRNPVGHIAPRPDKSFDTYVYFAMDVGATRLEEQKVVEVACKEDA